MLSEIGAIVQRHDRERFVTALFAPVAQREALFALYAFNHELARAREVASEPHLVLIRLHWWREVVEGAERRHEVATPLRAAIVAGVLPADGLLRLIAGREWEAQAGVGPAEWRAYLEETAGVLMGMAARVLGARTGEKEWQAFGAACGMVGMLRNAAAGPGRRWWLPEGVPVADAREMAVAALGPRRRWDRAGIAAALPAVFARRVLEGRAVEGVGSRLAVLRAAISARC